MRNAKPSKIVALQSDLDLSFADTNLLVQSFTHSSYTAEHPSKPHNERLEFLGDAVLELVMSEYLFLQLPKGSEGDMTRIRAAHVSEPALAVFAKRLSFDQYVLLGKGAEMAGERQRPAILADVFEAFLGALYLDQGLEAARSFIDRWVVPYITFEPEAVIDAKTRLQEVVQASGGKVSYQLLSDEGPASAERFLTRVFIDDSPCGEARGRSKKESEQRAAAEALRRLYSPS